jgi:glycerol-3-phosphate dehydrogenase subunit C
VDRVVYFSGCFANYYDPDVGAALLSVMRDHGIDVILSKQLCCGMPMMANMNRRGAERNFRKIVGNLYGEAKGELDIVTTCPSCNMMLKKEGKGFFPSPEADYVSTHVFDSIDYLWRMLLQGRLKTDFGTIDLRILYHNPCHLRVQGVERTPGLLALIPGIKIVGINRDCCGMGGSFGMKKANYEVSQRIGKKVWRMVEELKPDFVVTECGGCGLQIGSGTGVKVVHPIVLVSRAYGAARMKAA